MLLQPPNLLEKRAVKLVLKTKESRLFFAEMVRLKKLIERTILVKSIANSTGGKDYFDQFKCSNAGRQKEWDLHTWGLGRRQCERCLLAAQSMPTILRQLKFSIGSQSDLKNLSWKVQLLWKHSSIEHQFWNFKHFSYWMIEKIKFYLLILGKSLWRIQLTLFFDAEWI